MQGDSEYDGLARWSESHGRLSDYRPKMEWLPIWLGMGLTAVLGVVMYWMVRTVAWVVARGWF